jgi:hypothetical protein
MSVPNRMNLKSTVVKTVALQRMKSVIRMQTCLRIRILLINRAAQSAMV